MKSITKGLISFSLLMLVLFFYFPSNQFLDRDINSGFYYIIIVLQLCVVVSIDFFSQKVPKLKYALAVAFFWPSVLILVAGPLLQEAGPELFYVFSLSSVFFLTVYVFVSTIFKHINSNSTHTILFLVFLLSSPLLLYVNMHDFNLINKGFYVFGDSNSEMAMILNIGNDSSLNYHQ